MATLADLEALVADTLPETEEEWEEPLPLEDPHGPPLPFDALPPLIRALAVESERAFQSPPDYALAAAGGAIGAATTGKYEVVYAPTNWPNAINTHGAIVGGPSEGKSPVIGALATDPITAWEKAKREALRAVVEEWQSKDRILKRQLEATEREHGKKDKDGGITDTEAIRQAALEELREHRKKKVVYPDVFGGNITPEAVEKKLHEQGGGYAVVSAESPFLSNAVGGRYSDKGGSNVDCMLQGWNGDHLSNERAGREEDLEVPHAYLAILCGVQPSVLRRTGREPDTIGRGVVARWLPVIPRSTVEHRTLGGRVAMSTETMAVWRSALERLLEVERTDSPRRIDLSPEAEAGFTSWHDTIWKGIGNQSEAMQGWLGKMGAQALKIAGQFHVIEHETPEDIPISLRTMQRAMRIAEYYRAHAEVMIGIMMDRRAGEPPEARQVLNVIRTLVDEDGKTTKRELHRKLRGRAAFQRADDLDAPLSLLQETNWIRIDREPLKDRVKGPAGRLADIITLNPSVLDGCIETYGQNGQNAHKQASERDSVHFVHDSLYTPANVTHLDAHRTGPLPPTGRDDEWSVEL